MGNMAQKVGYALDDIHTPLNSSKALLSFFIRRNVSMGLTLACTNSLSCVVPYVLIHREMQIRTFIQSAQHA